MGRAAYDAEPRFGNYWEFLEIISQFLGDRFQVYQKLQFHLKFGDFL